MILWIVEPINNTRKRVRLLLDTGSNNTFVVSKGSLKRSLKLLGKQKILLQSFNKSPDYRERNIFTGKFATSPHSLPSETFYDLQLISIDQISGPLKSSKLTKYETDFIKSHKIVLSDMDAAENNNLEIDILVGQDFYYDLIKGSPQKLSTGLVLIPTISGAVLAGKTSSSNVNKKPKILTVDYIPAFRTLSRDEEIDDVKKLTSLENMGIGPLEEEISPVLDRFNTTTLHNGERYTVVIPKRPRRIEKLPSNFFLAFKRVLGIYKRLSKVKNETDFIKYSGIMEEQLEANVLEKVACLGTITEVNSALSENPKTYDSIGTSLNTPVHYLYHFAVWKKSSGKMRLVYDASAKINNKSYSLNDCLDTGPDLINSLLSILIRFRLYPYELKSDIRKAFLNIEINESDRDLLRTFWIEGDKVWIYRFARLPFGLTCSPFILAATLKKHLENSNIPPEKQKDILQSFYVDDNISGANNLDELIEFKSLMENTLKNAGMPLGQFNSNHPEMRKLLIQDDPDVPDTDTVLGVIWNLVTDEISINCDHTVEPVGPVTGRTSKLKDNSKRGVYSKMGKTFDPLGLISPFIFQGKLILRDICDNVKNWDSNLPPKFLEPWKNWVSQLSHLNSFKVPRYIGIPSASEIYVVGFSDASKLGFAACIYYVAKTCDGESKSNLLISKTHLAPKNMKGIPRLELLGALLLSNLMSHVKKAIPNISEEKFYYFTDSLNVLYWLRSNSSDWPIFVSNRLEQILQSSKIESWRHIPSELNPADIPSRGCSLANLSQDSIKHKLFFRGPDFMINDINSYRSHVDIRVMPKGCMEELGKVTLVNSVKTSTASIINIIQLSEYNSYTSLIKITRVVLKAIEVLSPKLLGIDKINKDICYTKYIHTSKAALLWIKAIQLEHYSEFFILAKNESDKNNFQNIAAAIKNKFCQFNIFLDKEFNILRCRMRTQNSSLDFTTSNPILLPPESHFTTLLVKHTHERLLHAGKSQTVAALRTEFYIPKLTQLVSRLHNKCIKCTKAYGKAYPLPPPPDLPEFRVSKCRVFLTVGVDYAGPFHTRERFVDKTFFDYKSYVLLFVCANCRGVHFEATNSLNAYDFKLAFERFISERGTPNLIVSDNAKTFVASNQKFNAIFKSKMVSEFMQDQCIEWKFYTDKAPWMGGFIERIVGLFKKISNTIIGAHHISFEEFRTFVKSAQATINSRPLTYLCEGLEEGIPLTPALLMHGFNLTDLPSHSLKGRDKTPDRTNKRDDQLTLEQRYHMLENIKDSFWNRWSSQYLTELQDRHLRQSKKQPRIFKFPKIGDVCLLKKEKTPRRHWPLAIVESVIEKAGKIRTVSVRTLNESGKVSKIDRSPSFLIPLEENIYER